MSCCGDSPGYDELDEVSKLVATKLAAFLKTLREAGFAVGPREGQDAASLMAAGYAEKPGLLRSAFKHLFSARKTRLGAVRRAVRRVLARQARPLALPHGRLDEGGQQPVAEEPAGYAVAARRQARPRPTRFRRPTMRRRTAPAKAAWKAPRAPTILPKSISARWPTPTRSRQAHEVAARLARTMRTRLTRRDLARRRGYRLDLRRTIHGNISHGGVPISLVKRQRKEKPLRLVMLLDASGSMSMYTGVFLRFIHGVLDEFREAEAFLFHTRLAYVSDAMKEKDPGRALDRLSIMAQGAGGGTRIGESLQTFNRWHAARVIHSRTCVMIVSDGYETGDAALLGREMAALARRCRRIVWLNPMMAWEGYAPEAAGIKAALPHVDLYAPANTLKSLTELEPYLAKL